jgi:hypothetical protein
MLLVAFGLVVGGCSTTGTGGGTSSPANGPPGLGTGGPATSPATSAVAAAGGPTSPSIEGSERSPASADATVAIYLLEGTPEDCKATRAVVRTVASRSPEAALRALLAGPTPDEIALGYSSWFSAATADMLDGVSVAGGVARVSFRDLRPVIPNASSSCGSSALLSALDATLGQFPEVRATRYSILGDEPAFYEWLQRGVPAD